MKKRGKNRSNAGAVLPFIDKNSAGHVLTFFSAFVLAWARLGFDISPFAAAFAASVPGKRSVAAILGSCCACLLDLDGTYTARLASVAVCTGLINYCLSCSDFRINRHIVAPVSCGVCGLLSGITVLAAQGFSADGLVTYFCESVVSAGCAGFLSRLEFPKGFFKGNEPLDMKQLSGVTVFFGMMVMSADRFLICGVSVAHIAAMAIILIASRLVGLAGGCISAGVMGFAACLLPDASLVGIIYTFAGIVCGITARFGRVVQCGAFLSMSVVVLFVNAGEFRMLPALFELAAAVIIFAVIPGRFFDINEKYFATGNTVPEFEAMKKALMMELDSISGGLDEVAAAVDRIADEIQKIENGSESVINTEMRQLVRDQFSILSTAVREITGRFADETRFDTQTSAKIHAVLSSYGIRAKEVVCSNTGRTERINITAERINGKISRSALTDDIENVCGYKLNIPDIVQNEDLTHITYEKKPRYNLRTGCAQRIAQGKMCGDSCDDFSDKDGNRIIIISDGMGTGAKAAVDGTVAAWLFSKLIAAGLGFESSLRLVNSAMIVKSTEESLATIDAVRINLNSGKTDFFKAGAGITLVCKGKKVYRVGNPSMPLGILREIESDRHSLTLKRGDKLLMMSDGVAVSAHAEIAEKLSRFNKNDPSELAEEVVEIAEKYSKSKHPDDITAVAVIVG
ncbi:MAG: SpoIIE family protein phosphatase [Clostridia bacterium]|nr:SpoIIE family protein phosphatase [Clostridia bacterium]